MTYEGLKESWMAWTEAVGVCNTKTAQTGEHWAVEPVPGGWEVVNLGPYSGAPAGTPAAAIYFNC